MYTSRTGVKSLDYYFNLLKHRGPDMSNYLHFRDNIDYITMGFHRLEIRGLGYEGMQPFYSERTGVKLFCMVNGEIYNTREIEVEYGISESRSDCEVVLRLFEHFNFNAKKLCQTLRGYYAFVIYERGKENTLSKLYIGTDEMSIRPLFIGLDGDSITIASEMLAIPEKYNESIMRISPGHIYLPLSGLKRIPKNIDDLKSVQYPYFFWNVSQDSVSLDNSGWFNSLSEMFSKYKSMSKTFEDEATSVRETLMESVKEQMVSDRDVGFLLSGGLDSSLVCSIAARYSQMRIKTFTVGLVGDDFSENEEELPMDILEARKVAQHIGSDHHEYFFNMSTALHSIVDVVGILGSWDQTTIRASVPMYLCVKKIREEFPSISVLFSGEIADEMFQGYLYNRRSPSPEEGMIESVRRMRDICYFDGLRADRIASSLGMELRLPFFDKRLIKVVLNCNPKYLHPPSNGYVEKRLLRMAFDGFNFLPETNLWRVKGALSDESSKNSSWKTYIKTNLTDIIPFTPGLNEDDIYKYIFDIWYGLDRRHLIPYKWMPLWCPEVGDDSSATAIDFQPKFEVVVEE